MESADNIRIRTAAERDAAELLEIYRPYVEKTAITFEYDVPTVAEFSDRIRNISRKYPYIVVEENGKILGYSYTSAFIGRAAYGWAAEVTIYLKADRRRAGVGRKLYTAIEAISRTQNITNLNACIGCTENEDEYLTNNSIQFHFHMGYRLVGEFYKCGYKFGRWYNMAWMEKIIGPHEPSPPDMIPFPELPDRELRDMGIWKT